MMFARNGVEFFVNKSSHIFILFGNLINVIRHKASDSIIGFLVLSKPASVQNVSCLGLFGRYSCPKSYA